MALTKVPESLINKTFGTAAETDTATILASALSAAQSEDTTAISTAVAQAAAANPFSNGLIHVRQEETSGTASGTFTAGSWQTRVLNTVKTNQVSGASLATNQLTLPAGTYLAMGLPPGYKTGSHALRLYDTTNSAELLVGGCSFADDSTDGSIAHVNGVFTLAAPAVVELQHRGTTTQASNGMGTSGGFGTEVFADLMLWKVA